VVIKCCEQVPQSQLMSVRRLVPVLIPSSFQSWVEPFKKLMKHLLWLELLREECEVAAQESLPIEA